MASAPSLMELLKLKKASMKKIDKTVKLKAGKNRVRILPGWRTIDKDGNTIPGADPTFWHEYGQHFIKDGTGPTATLQAVYLCTDATFNKPCEVCSALSAANRHVTDDDTQAILAEGKANRSTLVNALMLDSSEPNTPVILELKYGIFSKLVEIIEDYEGKPLDPEIGQEFMMTREGTGKLTKYDVSIRAQVYKVPTASLAKMVNLDEYVAQESDEQQRRAVAAVNSIVGLLPAPSDTPLTTATRLSAPKAKAAAAAEFEDIPDLEAVKAGNAAVAKAAEAAKRPDLALDSELDSLLADL